MTLLPVATLRRLLRRGDQLAFRLLGSQRRLDGVVHLQVNWQRSRILASGHRPGGEGAPDHMTPANWNYLFRS